MCYKNHISQTNKCNYTGSSNKNVHYSFMTSKASFTLMNSFSTESNRLSNRKKSDKVLISNVYTIQNFH